MGEGAGVLLLEELEHAKVWLVYLFLTTISSVFFSLATSPIKSNITCYGGSSFCPRLCRISHLCPILYFPTLSFS